MHAMYGIAHRMHRRIGTRCKATHNALPLHREIRGKPLNIQMPKSKCVTSAIKF